MNYKFLNKHLKNLNQLRNLSALRIEKTVVKELHGDGSQGQSGLSYEVYKLDKDVFVKLTINTDSYGDNEFVAGIEFVQPIEKTITAYDPI